MANVFLKASLSFTNCAIPDSTAVTKFIKSVNKQTCEGVDSIHSRCSFVLTSSRDFFTIAFIVLLICVKISTKYTSTFPNKGNKVSKGIVSTPVLVTIALALGLRLLVSSLLSCISNLSIAIIIFEICLLIDIGSLPLDKTSNKSTLDIK